MPHKYTNTQDIAANTTKKNKTRNIESLNQKQTFLGSRALIFTSCVLIKFESLCFMCICICIPSLFHNLDSGNYSSVVSPSCAQPTVHQSCKLTFKLVKQTNQQTNKQTNKSTNKQTNK